MTKGISTHSGSDNSTSVTHPRGKSHSGKQAGILNQWLARKLLSRVGDPDISLVLFDGTVIETDDGNNCARLLIHDQKALLQLIVNPEYYFGELYAAGRIEIDGDLVGLLCRVRRSMERHPGTYFPTLLNTIAQRFIPRNTLQTARQNILHHYDIGNAFYEKWLDREMLYTCAYFPDPEFTLEQAQTAKMHHICRKLMLQPGQTVVEAGCGWGGLARFMAREYGTRVSAYNISTEQINYARQRAMAEGLADRIEYIEDDYRNIRGKFDVFVSVGMLEHVGVGNYEALGKVIDACLKNTGVGLIHTIGRNRPVYMNPWIEKRIFPGACPPSIGQIMQILEPQNLSTLDIENLRLHYARTLEHWLHRFDNATGSIREQYDEEFVRAWRLYLCGSISAFLTGTMQLFQVLFSRPGRNVLPWSRSHLYSDHCAGKNIGNL